MVNGPGTERNEVGLVVGTTAATPLQFSVAVQADQYLQLDDVVTTIRQLPGQQTVRVSGVVTNVEAVHEGARFDSDVFLIHDGVLPAEVVEASDVMMTRVEPEIYVPPLPGSSVRLAVGPQRDRALYFDQMQRRLVIGLGRDSLPLFANFEFIDGTRGAHVNISGISGVATKTTTRCSFSTRCSTRDPRGGSANTKALIFNVKGEDLLFLDHANARLSEQRERYGALGLPAGPFNSVAIYAPPRRGDPSRCLTSPPGPGVTLTTGRSQSSSPRSCCRSFSWSRRTSGTVHDAHPLGGGPARCSTVRPAARRSMTGRGARGTSPAHVPRTGRPDGG